MAEQNPHVSVFHFTSRISSAKIRKYKLATERGMSTRNTDEQTPTENESLPPSGPGTTTFLVQTGQSPSNEPPVKKQRLRLSVRQPSDDTIAVARPSQSSAYKIRYSENMTVDSNNNLSVQTFQKPKAARQASVSRQSLSSPGPARTHVVPESEPRSAPEPSAPAASSKRQSDYGANFASYYIIGDDDENPTAPEELLEEEAKAAPLAAQPIVASVPSSVATKSNPQSTPKTVPDQGSKSQVLPAPTPAPISHAPSATHALHHPSVDLIDDIPRAPAPDKRITVAVMVEKLETLSSALKAFGGVPDIPRSAPLPDEKARKMSKVPEPRATDTMPGQKVTAVDNLLAMMDDDESDGDDGAATGQDVLQLLKQRPVDFSLHKDGESDLPLTYGIQFIQNALRSWAKQRLNVQYAQHYYHMVQIAGKPQPTKRGPGRPRKFDAWDDGRNGPHIPPVSIQMRLSGTPEGAAISAFQDVLDSNCLQVNRTMPVELSQALSRLYLQIDKLINQGGTGETPWQCMSYAAQIKAHRAQMDRWKDEQEARAQAEGARRQQLALQRATQHMSATAHSQQAPMAPSTKRPQAKPAEPLHAKSAIEALIPNQILRKKPQTSLDSAAGSASAIVSQKDKPRHAAFIDDSIEKIVLSSDDESSEIKVSNSGAKVKRASEKTRLATAELLPRSRQSMRLSFSNDVDSGKPKEEHASSKSSDGRVKPASNLLDYPTQSKELLFPESGHVTGKASGLKAAGTAQAGAAVATKNTSRASQHCLPTQDAVSTSKAAGTSEPDHMDVDLEPANHKSHQAIGRVPEPDDDLDMSDTITVERRRSNYSHAPSAANGQFHSPARPIQRRVAKTSPTAPHRSKAIGSKESSTAIANPATASMETSRVSSNVKTRQSLPKTISPNAMKLD